MLEIDVRRGFSATAGDPGRRLRPQVALTRPASLWETAVNPLRCLRALGGAAVGGFDGERSACTLLHPALHVVKMLKKNVKKQRQGRSPQCCSA